MFTTLGFWISVALLYFVTCAALAFGMGVVVGGG